MKSASDSKNSKKARHAKLSLPRRSWLHAMRGWGRLARGALQSLHATALLAAIILSTASCAGIVRGPDVESLMRDRDPELAFMASGSVTVSGHGTGFSGAILLSMEGDKFRLEVLDAVNRAVLAVGGEPGKMIRVDPATGERSVSSSDAIRAPELGGITAPCGLLRTAVTGSLPRFGKTVSASSFLGKSYVRTESPAMELVFAPKLMEVRVRTQEDGAVTLRLGPGSSHSHARNLEWSEISLGSGTVLRIRWNKVEAVKSFPQGFFTFEESEEDY